MSITNKGSGGRPHTTLETWRKVFNGMVLKVPITKALNSHKYWTKQNEMPEISSNSYKK